MKISLTRSRLDEHSALLLAEYAKHKSFFNDKLRCYFGRSRIATLTAAKNGRQACSYLGRCLWGCPSEAFYTPSITLRECKGFSNFRYGPGLHVSHFKFNGKRQITSIVAKSLNGKGRKTCRWTNWFWPREPSRHPRFSCNRSMKARGKS